MKRLLYATAALAALALASGAASAATFVNGDFETGTTAGWTTGTGYRGNTLNPSLTTAQLLPGGSLYDSPGSRSAIVGTSYVDPNLGSLLGSTVYAGNYSYRVEDTTNGGFASVISQTVANYTDPSIFFAWKAVLENGGHTADESAEMLIQLTDVTTGQVLITRQYNAGATGGGVDNRFSQSGSLFYTPDWQVEQLTINPINIGDTFTLSVLAADCEPTGHTGYVYLDGFGNANPVTPVTPVPEPATLGIFGVALGLTGLLRRKRHKG